jgi:hypothetical protein
VQDGRPSQLCLFGAPSTLLHRTAARSNSAHLHRPWRAASDKNPPSSRIVGPSRPELGPKLTTRAPQQLGSYPGYSGRCASRVRKAARDPTPTIFHRLPMYLPTSPSINRAMACELVPELDRQSIATAIAVLLLDPFRQRLRCRSGRPAIRLARPHPGVVSDRILRLCSLRHRGFRRRDRF